MLCVFIAPDVIHCHSSTVDDDDDDDDHDDDHDDDAKPECFGNLGQKTALLNHHYLRENSQRR